MFRPGHKKTGGRLKGTPNKKTVVLKSAEEIAAESGIEVLAEMMKIALKQKDLSVKFSMLKDIAPYLYSRKNSTDFNLSNVSTDELVELVQERMDEEPIETNASADSTVIS